LYPVIRMVTHHLAMEESDDLSEYRYNRLSNYEQIIMLFDDKNFEIIERLKEFIGIPLKNCETFDEIYIKLKYLIKIIQPLFHPDIIYRFAIKSSLRINEDVNVDDVVDEMLGNKGNDSNKENLRKFLGNEKIQKLFDGIISVSIGFLMKFAEDNSFPPIKCFNELTFTSSTKICTALKSFSIILQLIRIWFDHQFMFQKEMNENFELSIERYLIELFISVNNYKIQLNEGNIIYYDEIMNNLRYMVFHSIKNCHQDVNNILIFSYLNIRENTKLNSINHLTFNDLFSIFSEDKKSEKTFGILREKKNHLIRLNTSKLKEFDSSILSLMKTMTKQVKWNDHREPKQQNFLMNYSFGLNGNDLFEFPSLFNDNRWELSKKGEQYYLPSKLPQLTIKIQDDEYQNKFKSVFLFLEKLIVEWLTRQCSLSDKHCPYTNMSEIMENVEELWRVNRICGLYAQQFSNITQFYSSVQLFRNSKNDNQFYLVKKFEDLLKKFLINESNLEVDDENEKRTMNNSMEYYTITNPIENSKTTLGTSRNIFYKLNYKTNLNYIHPSMKHADIATMEDLRDLRLRKNCLKKKDRATSFSVKTLPLIQKFLYYHQLQLHFIILHNILYLYTISDEKMKVIYQTRLTRILIGKDSDRSVTFVDHLILKYVLLVLSVSLSNNHIKYLFDFNMNNQSESMDSLNIALSNMSGKSEDNNELRTITRRFQTYFNYILSSNSKYIPQQLNILRYSISNERVAPSDIQNELLTQLTIRQNTAINFNDVHSEELLKMVSEKQLTNLLRTKNCWLLSIIGFARKFFKFESSFTSEYPEIMLALCELILTLVEKKHLNFNDQFVKGDLLNKLCEYSNPIGFSKDMVNYYNLKNETHFPDIHMLTNPYYVFIDDYRHKPSKDFLMLFPFRYPYRTLQLRNYLFFEKNNKKQFGQYIEDELNLVHEHVRLNEDTSLLKNFNDDKSGKSRKKKSNDSQRDTLAEKLIGVNEREIFQPAWKKLRMNVSKPTATSNRINSIKLNNRLKKEDHNKNYFQLSESCHLQHIESSSFVQLVTFLTKSRYLLTRLLEKGELLQHFSSYTCETLLNLRQTFFDYFHFLTFEYLDSDPCKTLINMVDKVSYYRLCIAQNTHKSNGEDRPTVFGKSFAESEDFRAATIYLLSSIVSNFEVNRKLLLFGRLKSYDNCYRTYCGTVMSFWLILTVTKQMMNWIKFFMNDDAFLRKVKRNNEKEGNNTFEYEVYPIIGSSDINDLPNFRLIEGTLRLILALTRSTLAQQNAFNPYITEPPWRESTKTDEEEFLTSGTEIPERFSSFMNERLRNNQPRSSETDTVMTTVATGNISTISETTPAPVPLAYNEDALMSQIASMVNESQHPFLADDYSIAEWNPYARLNRGDVYRNIRRNRTTAGSENARLYDELVYQLRSTTSGAPPVTTGVSSLGPLPMTTNVLSNLLGMTDYQRQMDGGSNLLQNIAHFDLHAFANDSQQVPFSMYEFISNHIFRPLDSTSSSSSSTLTSTIQSSIYTTSSGISNSTTSAQTTAPITATSSSVSSYAKFAIFDAIDNLTIDITYTDTMEALNHRAVFTKFYVRELLNMFDVYMNPFFKSLYDYLLNGISSPFTTEGRREAILHKVIRRIIAHRQNVIELILSIFANMSIVNSPCHLTFGNDVRYQQLLYSGIISAVNSHHTSVKIFAVNLKKIIENYKLNNKIIFIPSVMGHHLRNHLKTSDIMWCWANLSADGNFIIKKQFPLRHFSSIITSHLSIFNILEGEAELDTWINIVNEAKQEAIKLKNLQLLKTIEWQSTELIKTYKKLVEERVRTLYLTLLTMSNLMSLNAMNLLPLDSNFMSVMETLVKLLVVLRELNDTVKKHGRKFWILDLYSDTEFYILILTTLTNIFNSYIESNTKDDEICKRVFDRFKNFRYTSHNLFVVLLTNLSWVTQSETSAVVTNLAKQVLAGARELSFDVWNERENMSTTSTF
ncbi:hypothetical protein SNEBB_006072, partial [Seison nebaliae]